MASNAMKFISHFAQGGLLIHKSKWMYTQEGDLGSTPFALKKESGLQYWLIDNTLILKVCVRDPVTVHSLQLWRNYTQLTKLVQQSLYRSRPWGVQRGWRSQISRYQGGKVVSLRNMPGRHFCYRLSRPLGHSQCTIPMIHRESNPRFPGL